MSIGLVGKKCGMTRIFTEDGRSIPVTVVEATPNRVTQIKDTAVQVTAGTVKASRLNKPEAGHFAKAKVEAGRGLWELKLENAKNSEFKVGDEITVEQFEAGQKVKVTATSKGKGFSGCIKRHNFKSQRASHGNSLSHNAPGSIGQNQTPGRVFKGKKMAGQLGNEKVTTLNLEIIRVDKDRNALLIKGAIPGAPGGNVIIRDGGRK